jgi:hypothetical protein
VFGFTQIDGVRLRFPGKPKYGQPSVHVTGESDVRRPTELWSCMEKPHHSPVPVSTIPPWCNVNPELSFELGGVISNGGVSRRLSLTL